MFIDALAWLNKFGYQSSTGILRQVVDNFDLQSGGLVAR
jgi:hypothetical protein